MNNHKHQDDKFEPELYHVSHYDYIDTHFGNFLKHIGLNSSWADGIGTAHGDKAYQYEQKWSDAGIHFHHGCLLYLLTYLPPYDKEVRNTSNGWVDPCQWVIENYNGFKHILPPV